MKKDEVREHLARLNAEDLRLVAAHLYKMLPKKTAETKGADRLLADPAGFLQTARVKKPPELPDLEMLEFETEEFLDNAANQRYFAPNKIIPKGQRSRWRFLAKRLYQDWWLLAAQPESQVAAAKALEDLYRILCHGSEVWMFSSTEPFHVIGVPRQEFFSQLILIKAQFLSANEWISQALSLMLDVKSTESTTVEMHGAFLSLLTTAELKESALQILTRELGKSSSAPPAPEFSDRSRRRSSLLRLGFQVNWAFGDKERSLKWLRAFVGGENRSEHVVLQLLLETGDREFWMNSYETARSQKPSAVADWDKTYEQARLLGELPAWQVR
ncbi:MAG: hypothetical protein HY736_27515 [Verrucomicrobia bacterium]|nr:hypothetical protein [Verrucomicrobiota bacterium]